MDHLQTGSAAGQQAPPASGNKTGSSIFMVTARRPFTEGQTVRFCWDQPAVDEAAAELINELLAEQGRHFRASARNWKRAADRLAEQDVCSIEVDRYELPPLTATQRSASSPDALSLAQVALAGAEAFIAGFDDDPLQEGIDALLRDIRSAIAAITKAQAQ